MHALVTFAQHLWACVHANGVRARRQSELFISHMQLGILRLEKITGGGRCATIESSCSSMSVRTGKVTSVCRREHQLMSAHVIVYTEYIDACVYASAHSERAFPLRNLSWDVRSGSVLRPVRHVDRVKYILLVGVVKYACDIYEHLTDVRVGVYSATYKQQQRHQEWLPGYRINDLKWSWFLAGVRLVVCNTFFNEDGME